MFESRVSDSFSRVLDRGERAAKLAFDFLIREAERGFPEIRHTMEFPRWPGVFMGSSRHASDLFARAVAAVLVLQAMNYSNCDANEALRELVEEEAEYIKRSKLQNRKGGWSYFPSLAELPPDLDSLSAAIRLFLRVSRAALDLCQEPLDTAFANRRADGSFRTWLISDQDPRRARRRMQTAVRKQWGDHTDFGVCCRFYLALAEWDREKFSEVLEKGEKFVVRSQGKDGSWQTSWYWGDVYGTSLALEFLRQIEGEEHAVRRGEDFLLENQRSTGGWGVWESVPLDTSIALWAMGREFLEKHPQVLMGGIQTLLRFQRPDGAWNATPWIQMDPGRATGRKAPILTYGSRTLTTAFCLRALNMATS